jgi:hypothetical protein
LWIQQVTLLFKTYKETPISTGQQQRITDWLNTWNNTRTTRSTQQNDMTKDNIYCVDSGSEIDNNEIRGDHLQTNITNWVKSWSDEDHSQGSVSTLCGECSILSDFKFTLHVSCETYSVLSANCLEGGHDCGICNIGVDYNM